MYNYVSSIILHNVYWNTIVCLIFSCKNQLSCGRLGHRNIDVWIQHSVLLTFTNGILWGLVDSNIKMPARRSTYTNDVLHFYAKLLDSLHHWCQNVELVGIPHKQQNTNFWSHFNVGLNILNPFDHCTLIHLCTFLAMIFTARRKLWELFVYNPAITVPLHMSIRGNFV